MTTPDTSTLLTAHDDGLLTVTINRPERGNALDGATVDVLLELLGSLAEDQAGVRSILLRSEGKHFCTGADIGGGGDRGGERPAIGHMGRSLGTGAHLLVQTLWNCRLPVVAELTGRSSGLGLHLALACDFTVAGASSTFAEPFSDRGFSVDSGGSWLLPRFIGLSRAKRMLYTAQPVDAATAVDWGLVSEVVPDDEVRGRALELASGLGRRPTYSIGETKALLHRHLGRDLGDALEAEAAAVELTIRSDDFKEGMRAFIAKRDPEFTGR